MSLALPVPTFLFRICADYVARMLRLIAPMLLACGATAAHAEWREATSAHFVVVSDGSQEQLIRFSQRLEALHWLLGQATGLAIEDNGVKVRIYLVDDVASVRRAMGRGNRNAAGFYRASTEGAIAVVPRNQGDFSATILYHEYAHHFMLQYLPSAYPAWYVEGFAELLSTARFDRPGYISYGFPAQHRAAELAYAPWTPVSQMMAAPSSEDDGAGTASYGQYWLATHFFVFSPERRGQLTAYFQLLNSGQSHDEALSAFPGGARQLDNDLRRYLSRNRFSFQRVPLPENAMAAPAIRLLRPGEAAIIDDELQAARPMSAQAHLPIAARVRAIAARYPEDPAVALLEARLWYYAGRYADAEQAADRTLALDPDNVHGLTLKGQIMLEARSAAGGEFTPELVREARRFIVRANRIDPENQLPLIAFYQSFRIAGETVPNSAVDGLYKASTLVPQEPGLRMTVALELLDRNNLPGARRMLAPLALSPHRSPLQAYALALTDWIDNGATGDRPQPGASPASDDTQDGPDEGDGATEPGRPTISRLRLATARTP